MYAQGDVAQVPGLIVRKLDIVRLFDDRAVSTALDRLRLPATAGNADVNVWVAPDAVSTTAQGAGPQPAALGVVEHRQLSVCDEALVQGGVEASHVRVAF